jgi:hypothetical protein
MTPSSKKRCRPDNVPGKVGFAPGHCELAKPALLIVRFEKVDRAQVRRMGLGIAGCSRLAVSALRHLPKLSAMTLTEADAVCARWA